MANTRFRPYEMIKELYNPERLTLPAIRDQMLNSIFLGKSSEKTETMLDNQNIPFFDLWTFCINHYRYSIYETPRSELIVTPDTMSCVPPMPNIIFPDEYVHYGREMQLRGLVTRYFEQGFYQLPNLGNEPGLNVQADAAQEAFVAPTSDIAPEIEDVIKGEVTPFDLSKSGEEQDQKFITYRQIPLEEEFHYGANYFTGDGEFLLKMGENIARTNQGSIVSGEASGEDGEASITLSDEYNKFHKVNVLYKYFLSRLQSQKTQQVRITFTPRLIPGMPVLLLSRTGRHIFGLITSMNHIIDAGGVAETHLVIEYQYLYDDATKRPLYFFRDRAKEEQMTKSEDDPDTYVWKNYFMLSNNFRDKNIGKTIYNKILFDGISKTDYNPFSTNWKGLKDKSILGIHVIFKDANNSTNKKKEDKPVKAKIAGILATNEECSGLSEGKNRPGGASGPSAESWNYVETVNLSSNEQAALRSLYEYWDPYNPQNAPGGIDGYLMGIFKNLISRMKSEGTNIEYGARFYATYYEVYKGAKDSKGNQVGGAVAFPPKTLRDSSVVLIFHTHPSGKGPSSADVDNSAFGSNQHQQIFVVGGDEIWLYGDKKINGRYGQSGLFINNS